MAGYIRASVLEGLNRIATRKNANVADVLRDHGLDMTIFQAQETEIDFDVMRQLFEDCATRWKMPDLGIQLAREQNLESLGVISLVVRMETTVRDAVKAVIRNQYLHTNGTVIILRELSGDDLAEVIYAPRTLADVRQAPEFALAGSKMRMAEASGREPEILSAEVMHSAPKGKDYLAASLGCPVRYGASRYSFLFRSDILDVKMPKMDVAYHPIIRRYLSDLAVNVNASFSERVGLEVFRLLSLGNCTQEKVAAAMRMQTRSLQRRLKTENTSFREILDEQRRRKSLALVQQTDMPLSEVALAVGYSDQTAFNQAFRRWFGRTPLKVRRPD